MLQLYPFNSTSRNGVSSNGSGPSLIPDISPHYKGGNSLLPDISPVIVKKYQQIYQVLDANEPHLEQYFIRSAA